MAATPSFVQVKLDMATEWKAMGNGAFKSKDYTRAQAYYSQPTCKSLKRHSLVNIHKPTCKSLDLLLRLCM
ncbi:unnamed protein product [Aphanomyces euteiches]